MSHRKIRVSYEFMICAALAVTVVTTILVFINAVFSAPMVA